MKRLNDFSMVFSLRHVFEFAILTIGLCIFVALYCHSPQRSGSELSVQVNVANENPESVPGEMELRRRPVVCCLNKSESVLLVANERSGTLSAIQVDEGDLIGEWEIGSRLSDLVHWKDELFLASDSEEAKLICLDFAVPEKPQILWRIRTIESPNKLLLDADNQRCFVGGLWSRRLEIVVLPDAAAGETNAKSGGVVDLPFCAGEMCRIEGPLPAILVLDAFSSGWSTHKADSLATIGSGRNRSRRAAGVAVNPDSGEVCMTEQTLNHLAHSVRNDVHWGTMLGNNIRVYSASQFVEQTALQSDPTAGEVASWLLSGDSTPLGGASDAKADPESILFANNGSAIISLAGVDQVAVGKLEEHSFKYYPTGRRPLGTEVTANNKLLFVCNNLDDSITVINLRDREVETTISLGKQPEPTQVDRGERLYFDGRVSHDGWMSCHSCHVNGHSNGFLNDNLGDQSFGAPKRVPSLLGRAETEPFAWNGSFATMHDQIRSSIVNTMQADEPPSDDSIDSLAAYVISLSPPPGLVQSRTWAAMDITEIIGVIESGRELFNNLGCATCHAPEQNWTTRELYDVGLTDELGNRQFNPPSLIGVGQQSAWFHDARFEQLQDVFLLGKHNLDRKLSAQELHRLLTFLNSL